ncbi:MAG: HipA N-terminal domain-containing protein [Treponema sp.]|nr:HipA N-terminal domain-containing protein [Treponema sp.]
MMLDVFLGSRKAGVLSGTADRGIVFAYSPEYISYGGAVPLSASLSASRTHRLSAGKPCHQIGLSCVTR